MGSDPGHVRETLASLISPRAELHSVPAQRWQSLCRESEYSKVVELLYDTQFVAGGLAALPGFDGEAWCQANALRNKLLSNEASLVVQRLSEAGIAVILFKGIFYLHTLYLDRPAVRRLEDIDLLIRESDIAYADALVREMGYRAKDPLSGDGHKSRLYFSCERQGFELAPVHLHWHAINLSAPVFKIFAANLDMDEVWEQAIALQGYPAQTYGMCDEHVLLFACHHAMMHGFARLNILYDIHAWITAHRNLDWRRVVATAERWGMEVALGNGILLVKELFATFVPDEIWQDMRYSRQGISERLGRWYVRTFQCPSEDISSVFMWQAISCPAKRCAVVWHHLEGAVACQVSAMLSRFLSGS